MPRADYEKTPTTTVGSLGDNTFFVDSEVLWIVSAEISSSVGVPKWGISNINHHEGISKSFLKPITLPRGLSAFLNPFEGFKSFAKTQKSHCPMGRGRWGSNRKDFGEIKINLKINETQDRISVISFVVGILKSGFLFFSPLPSYWKLSTTKH